MSTPAIYRVRYENDTTSTHEGATAATRLIDGAACEATGATKLSAGTESDATGATMLSAGTNSDTTALMPGAPFHAAPEQTKLLEMPTPSTPPAAAPSQPPSPPMMSSSAPEWSTPRPASVPAFRQSRSRSVPTVRHEAPSSGGEVIAYALGIVVLLSTMAAITFYFAG